MSRRLTGALGAAAGACMLLSALAVMAPAAGATVPAPRAAAAQQWEPRVPTPGNNGSLNAVGCSPAGQCWAVGAYLTNGKHHPSRGEMLRWTGSRWQLTRIPEPGSWSSLSGISCPSPRYCLATGLTTSARGHAGHALVLRWTGTGWSAASAPAGGPGLGPLSCTAPGNCWALNARGDRAVHWNGHRWAHAVRLPKVAAPSGITCVTATDCWVVGFSVKPNSIHLYNFAAHWNGRTWSDVPVPQPAPHYNQLNAVTCVSSADCWAAGSDEKSTSPHIRNEVLHWDGSRWSLVPIPKGPLENSELLAIECLTRSDCWATGDDDGSAEALHWNGSRWSLVPTPSPGPGRVGFLYGVQCLSPADCLAVGFGHLPPTQNLALRWNGTRWETV